MTFVELMDSLWEDFCEINPQALVIHQALQSKEELVKNDHIALRTLNFPGIQHVSLGEVFEQFGFVKKESYQFPKKKLDAYYWAHPEEDHPKVFISHLKVEELSPWAQEKLQSLHQSLLEQKKKGPLYLKSGASWERSYEVFQKLSEESEYAGWFYNYGFRPNHFTVSVNHLKGFEGLESLNHFIKDLGFPLNQSGGEIKGNPECLLEQSSTLASQLELSFKEGNHSVPGCYYEFAKRYNGADNELYQGFIASNADKIFESTHSRSS